MIDRVLESHLAPFVRRRRQYRFWSSLALVWLGTGLVGLPLLALRTQIGLTSRLPWFLLVALGAGAVLFVILRQRRDHSDWRWAARQIEATHQDLKGLLLTAAQQEPADDGHLSYLQTRLVQQAVEHSAANKWSAAALEFRFGAAHAAHLLALVFCLAVLWGLRPAPGQVQRASRAPAGTGMTVTPGDTSLERGSSLVVMARFEGRVPPSVDLLLSSGPQPSRRVPLVRSLADPMFGGSVPEVETDFVYHLEYGGERTRDFRVKVFEHPKLERADAALTYPAYTGQAPKRLDDTRRLSAVEGTRLDLTLQLNKPVVSARLVPKGEETNALSLVVEGQRAAAALRQFALTATKTYQLQLVDADGRTNKAPTQFVFDVLKNRRPELKLASPRGDIRPSALEEVLFEGSVWDDFGVRAYGLAYSRAGGEPKVIELGGPAAAKEKRAFRHMLRLEDLGLKPDDLVSWFVWADDLGTDGLPRRTPGDLFFAEVRPFDEIFREGQGGESQSAQQQSGEPSGQQGSPSAKLAELQKQIISATWKLWREQGGSPASPPAGSEKGSGQTPPRDPDASAKQTPSARTTGGHAPLGGRSTALPNFVGLASSGFAQDGIGPGHGIARSIVVMAQRAAGDPAAQALPRSNRVSGAASAAQSAGDRSAPIQDDAGVVRDSQAQALEQAETSRERVQDPRLAALWEAAAREMARALEKLEAARQSPALLPEALAAEQAAYQALLKLQEREYSVSRRQRGNQRGSQSGNSRQQQMQQQLDQLELKQSENRYETERQAQAPQSPERREQLQVMNRLAELARRQQDLNERFKELQTALQEAPTEPQREELRRQLKRLQEEEQKMLADMDELQQRMERPENQSRMAEQRRQLEQARQDMQRAADAAQQGSASQAQAAGTRAQRQMQQTRDEMRRQNASEFAEDLRQMRADARELARQQEEIQKKMDGLADNRNKSLSDSGQSQEVLDRLARQKERLTNLVERTTQVSKQTEEAEPLVSRELYDTLRKFSQDEAGSVKRLQEDLVNSGRLSRTLNERLKEAGEQAGAKSLEVTSEMLREGLLPQASQAEERARAGIGGLRRGVERAAERVLGDDAEALRLAQRQLGQLTEQLEREIAQAQRSGTTNGSPQAGASREAQDAAQQQGQNAGQQAEAGQARQGGARQPGQGQRQQGQGGDQRPAEQAEPGNQAPSPGEQAQAGSGAQGQGRPDAPAQGNPQTEGGQPQGRGGQNAGNQTTQTERPGPGGQQERSPLLLRDPAQRGDRSGSRRTGGSTGGDRGGIGDLAQGWDWLFDERRGGSSGPITGNDFAPWSDGLREVEEMVESPSLRNEIATARERARLMRQDYKRALQKPDWAVVRLQVIHPLVEVRKQIADELARREPKDKLAPIDRDPVPAKYSDLVRRYYEELGKEK
jgi:hypothetical protein